MMIMIYIKSKSIANDLYYSIDFRSLFFLLFFIFLSVFCFLGKLFENDTWVDLCRRQLNGSISLFSVLYVCITLYWFPIYDSLQRTGVVW